MHVREFAVIQAALKPHLTSLQKKLVRSRVIKVWSLAGVVFNSSIIEASLTCHPLFTSSIKCLTSMMWFLLQTLLKWACTTYFGGNNTIRNETSVVLFHVTDADQRQYSCKYRSIHFQRVFFLYTKYMWLRKICGCHFFSLGNTTSSKLSGRLS